MPCCRISNRAAAHKNTSDPHLGARYSGISDVLGAAKRNSSFEDVVWCVLSSSSAGSVTLRNKQRRRSSLSRSERGRFPDSPTVSRWEGNSVSLFLTARSRPRQTAGGQGQTARGGPQPPHPTADVSSSFLVFLRIASSGGLGGTLT